MSLKHKLSSLFRNLFMRSDKDKDVDEELESYVGLLAEEKVQAGLDPRTAAREARVELGGKESVKEKIRQFRLGHSFDTLVQDIRYGVRMLRKNPGFTVVAVLTLALGIGANTAIFSVVNAVLLRPLPYEEPEELVRVYETWPARGEFRREHSAPNFLDIREQVQSLEHFEAIAPATYVLTGEGPAERLSGAVLTGKFLALLSVSPIVGRDFNPEEVRPGGPRATLLSHAYWSRRFGADPSILGKNLMLDGDEYTVVGILPSDFYFPGIGADVWTSRAIPERNLNRRGWRYLHTFGRLKEGLELTQVQAEMETIAARLEKQYPGPNEGRGARVMPWREDLVGSARASLLMLLGMVGFILLIACANVAHIVLSRAIGRRKEIAVRAALGASRARLLAQVLVESVLLALFGGLAGLVVAVSGANLIVALSPGDLPRLSEFQIDASVLAFNLLVSLLAGILFGIVPAWQAFRVALFDPLREGHRWGAVGSTRHRLRSGLVVAEVALALVLVTGAGLMINSFLRLQNTTPGFQIQNLLTAKISLSMNQYENSAQWRTFFSEVLSRLKNLPGMELAAPSLPVPLSGDSIRLSFEAEGKQYSDPSEIPNVYWRSVSSDYFRVMRIPLSKGRYFTDLDREGQPDVLIINETAARRFWPDEDPIGKRVTIGYNDILAEIVGVVGPVKHRGLDEEITPEMYSPFPQAPYYVMSVVVRTATGIDPTSVVPTIRSQVHAVDDDVPVHSVATMESMVYRSIAQPRFYTFLLGTFAAVALVLAMVGVYGVIAYSVSQRTHELGIRIALGARPRDIFRMVIGQGLGLAFLGVVLGLIGALALTRYLETWLFGITPTDPLTFAVVSTLLVGVALLACFFPARRATKVDPMVALRYE